MGKAKIPLEKAIEPNEEACQPKISKRPRSMGVAKKTGVKFADGTSTTEKTCSQSSSTLKAALSQPAPGLSHRQKMQWLQSRRGTGLWAQCDDCDRWRYLPRPLDSHDLPSKWFCWMNPDSSMATCAATEAPLACCEEEDLIHAAFAAGSVVWARLPGYPAWPAMVDDCPDAEQYYWLDGFSDIPTYYNVVFFDEAEATRAWISTENLKPFTAKKTAYFGKDKIKYKKRLQVAKAQASEALKLTLNDRLAKYSFIARYRGSINTPKKIDKKVLIRHQKKLQKQLNLNMPLETSDESDEEPMITKRKKPLENKVAVRIEKKQKPAKKALENVKTGKEDKVLHESSANDTHIETASAIHDVQNNTFKVPDSLVATENTDRDDNLNSTQTFDDTNSREEDIPQLTVPETVTQSEEPAITESDLSFTLPTPVTEPNSDDFEF